MRPTSGKTTRFFEDLRIGERYDIPSRTHSESLFYAFQLVSGDNRPSHYNREHCRSLGFPDMWAHGFQILCQTAPGASDMSRGASEVRILGMIEQSSKFLTPVFCGDTLYPLLEVVDLIEQNTTGVMVLRSTVHNQKDELCLEGEIRLLIAKKNWKPKAERD